MLDQARLYLAYGLAWRLLVHFTSIPREHLFKLSLFSYQMRSDIMVAVLRDVGKQPKL